MGIKGLLGSLKPYVEPVHVSKYAGQRVGIDCYSWLHKGAYACSRELLESGGLITGPRMPAYVAYCAHRIQMLKHNKVVPVVVFDGARLPMKAGTEAERRRNKNNSLEEARTKLAAGDERGAEEAFQRSVDITPQMALQVMKYLRREGVDFIVAPYEADAQLAALATAGKENGGIAAVITEDSDLLAYGCSTVLYKMDKYGNAEEISTERLFSSVGPGSQGPASQASSGRQQGGTCLSFRHFNQELFLGMCILAGCDFLPSIPGIGISKAHAVVNKYRNVDRALSRLKLDAKLVVPPGYAREYARARATFAHARVYDPASKRLVHLNPLPEGFAEGFGGDIDFLGPDMSPSTARAIAEGRVNPLTMEAFAGTEADTWLTRVPRSGATWQGVGAQQGATWRSGKSPKKAKGSPRSKATPGGRRPAHVDLEADTDPSSFGRPEREAPPRPRPPATVDLSAFRNFAVPRNRVSGLNQPSSNPSQAESLDPMGLDADGVRVMDGPERNRTAEVGDVGSTQPQRENATAECDGYEPPDVSMEESEDVWGTQREPRQQPRQQESERLPARPVLSDLPRNPFKRRAEESAGGTSWVRQLTTTAPKPRKILSSKPPRYLNPFPFKPRGTDEGARFQEQKVSPFFAKPASPPSKPPSDPLSEPSCNPPFNPPSNPPSNPPLTSSAKHAANPSKSVVSEREAGPDESVWGVSEGQPMSPFQTKRPRKTGAEPTPGFSQTPKPVPARERLLDDECPLGGEAPPTEERNAAGKLRSQRSEGSRVPSTSLTEPSECTAGERSEELERRQSKPSEGGVRGPPVRPAEEPLESPQSCPVSSAPQTTLAGSSEVDQKRAGSEDRNDLRHNFPAPVPVASCPETSVPFFGPSLDSGPESRSEFGSQEVVPGTPSEELEPAEPLNVPEEALARGQGETSLEGLQSTWAATAASQAAAEAGRERKDLSDRGYARAEGGCTPASEFDGVQPDREAAESAAAAGTEWGPAAGPAFVDSNSESVLNEHCVAKAVEPGEEGTRGMRGAAKVSHENERTDRHAGGGLQKCPVDDRVDGETDAAAVDQVERFQNIGQVGKGSVDTKRVEASVQIRKVDEATVLNGLIDLESVELRGPSSLVRLSRPMVPRRQTVKPSSILNFFKPVKVPEGGEERPGKRPIVESRGTNRKLGPSVRKKHKR